MRYRICPLGMIGSGLNVEVVAHGFRSAVEKLANVSYSGLKIVKMMDGGIVEIQNGHRLQVVELTERRTDDGFKLDVLQNPMVWTKERVHNWHNYINDGVRELWNTLADFQKLAIAENAQDLADKENWD